MRRLLLGAILIAVTGVCAEVREKPAGMGRRIFHGRQFHAAGRHPFVVGLTVNTRRLHRR